METLTDKQKEMLEYIVRYQVECGYPPTMREIGEWVSLKSPSTVSYHLDRMIAKGCITRGFNASRNIDVPDNVFSRVLGMINNVFHIPLLGPIVASQPIPMPDTGPGGYYDEYDTVAIPAELLPRGGRSDDYFALRVQGDSMIDAMVHDGDIVIVKPTQEAVNGDMVVAWRNDTNSTTLKYFYKEQKRVRLQPANKLMDSVYVTGACELQIKGKVVMVLRQYDENRN